MKTYGLPYKGSKDKICSQICSLFPQKENFYDLFMGGGSITHYQLLQNRYKNYYANDFNSKILNFIKKKVDVISNVVEESMKSAKKSITESKISYEEFQDICNTESNNIYHFHEYKNVYFVILGDSRECEFLNRTLSKVYGLTTTYYRIIDPKTEFVGYYEIMCFN